MRRSSGPPAWLVFLVAIALVFGAYYLWTGLSTYLRTGGLGVVEATERAQIVATATAEEFFADNPRPTARPSQTPVPECQAFVVTVPSAIVRETPSTSGAIVTSLAQGSDVCVLQKEGEWYAIDTNPRSRRLDLAYMHESIIEAVNPTPTPSRTPSPLPTVTITPTLTPSQTFTPAPTDTADPDATDTLTPTRTSTPTPSFQSA